MSLFSENASTLNESLISLGVKHENLRDNCEYNTQWKLYLYLTKYLFR
jgi:hypothetical protein